MPARSARRWCGCAAREAGDLERPISSSTIGDGAHRARKICCNAGMGLALAVLLIAAASTTLVAQSSAPPTKLQSPPDGSTVTVTGCLTKGEPAGSFILTNVHFDSTNTPTTAQGQHHDQKQPPT